MKTRVTEKNGLFIPEIYIEAYSYDSGKWSTFRKPTRSYYSSNSTIKFDNLVEAKIFLNCIEKSVNISKRAKIIKKVVYESK